MMVSIVCHSFSMQVSSEVLQFAPMHAPGQEGYAACNPLQIGFARAFCDIHCVRDAVIRGDRAIIRNLELATKKTNSNLQKMVKWSVDAARAETGFLADKLDYMQLDASLSEHPTFLVNL